MENQKFEYMKSVFTFILKRFNVAILIIGLLFIQQSKLYAQQNPYGGTAWAVPGFINAEDYDVGGEGIAYHDLTPGNAGGVYRTDSVDVNTGWVGGAGPYYVACAATEWLEYTVDVTTAGGYIISASIANGGAASYRVTIDGADETVAIPAGSWSAYVDISTPEVTLTAGTHVLRFEAQVESFDFDKITFTSTANANPTASITAPAEAATFAAGADVIIDATAADSDGTVTKVEFYQNGNLLGEDLASPYSYTWTGVASGNYALTAVATDNGGATGTSTPINITVGSQAPYGGTAWAVPGTIEAEDYDDGGAGVAYFDTTPGGSTSAEAYTHRADDVDADTSWVDSNVIWVAAAATEWLEYTVNVAASGGYIISAGLATTETTASYKVYIDTDSLTQVSIPNTGDWSTITVVSSAEVTLTAGSHVLRFETLGGSYNFDNISITSTTNTNPTVSITAPAEAATFAAGVEVIIDATAADSDGTVTKVEFYQNGNLLGEDLTSPYSYTWTGVASGNYALTAVATDNSAGSTTSTPINITVGSQAPYGGTAWAVPGTIEAEDYDDGGAGVAYFDTTPGGSTSAEAYTHRADDVDADTSWVDSNVIWVAAAATEWLEYTVNVAATGGYIIAAGLATTETTASYKVYIDGDSLTQVSVPNTGDWSTITTVSSTEINLTAGEHILKFEVLGGSYNFDNMVITSTADNTNPTVSITSPIDAATFTTGTDVVIEATAADSDGTVAKVEFFQNGILLGEDTASPYSYTWASVASGNYALTAIVTDNMGATTTSSAVNIVVSPVVLSLEDPFNQAGLNITYVRHGVRLTGNATERSVASIRIFDISGRVLFEKERLDWVGTTEVSYTFDLDKIHIIRVVTSDGVSTDKIIFKMN